MCLDISKTITSRVKKSLRSGKVRFWKVFKIASCIHYGSEYGRFDFKDTDEALINLWRNTSVPTKISQRGFITSDRKSVHLNEIEIEVEEVNHGIHVFVNKVDAVNYAASRGWGAMYSAVPVYVDPKDFVAGGYGLSCENAVFKKVRIDLKYLRKNNLKNIQFYYGKKK